MFHIITGGIISLVFMDAKLGIVYVGGVVVTSVIEFVYKEIRR